MYKGEKTMPLKTFKSEVLGRTCISTIVELPIKGGFSFVPKTNETIEQISISEVKGHEDLITIAMIIHTDVVEEPLINIIPDA